MNELIEENMRLVFSIVNSFKPANQTERQDMIDAGRIGLWKALQKYDPSTGNTISTYAWKPIRWAIIKELKKNKKRNISLDKIAEPHIEEKSPIWEVFTNNLSPDDMTILNLRKQGYKFKEICVEVNRSSSSVKNRYYKMIKEIKKANIG